MNKLYIKYLSIEVTRRCNLACAHCLRGDAQDMDIDHRHIRNALKHFRHIHQLAISGGEPSLNPKAIRYILKQLKAFGIPVHNFYIVTNGSRSSISEEFIQACCELYEYQEGKAPDGYMLEMSDDRFHDARHHDKVITKLSRYPFFQLRRQCKYIGLIKEGRCKKGYVEPVFPIYLTDTDYVYGNVYLNAKGNIVSSCNLSYQRQSELALCHSGNFRSYLKTTLRKE